MRVRDTYRGGATGEWKCDWWQWGDVASLAPTERCERRFELAAGSGLKSSVTNGEVVFIYEKLGI